MSKVPQKVSIVIPTYNEEQGIKHFYDELVKVINDLPYDFELIFVNDGSKDNTLFLLKKIRENDQRVKIISFSKNFGHQIALTAGLDCAIGEAVIVMDSDLQHPPKMIPQFVAKWKEGYDIVYTIRSDTQDASFFKKFTSNFFYWVMTKLSNVKINAAPDYRLMDKKAVLAFTSLKEKHRFIRGLVNWVGFKQYAIEFVAEKRFAGQTKYSFFKMLNFAIDGITSFSSIPLTIAFYIGFFTTLISIIYAIYVIYSSVILHSTIEGWSSLMIIMLLYGGIGMMILGVIGKYIGLIYDEVKNRPLYIVDEKIGFDYKKE